MSLKCITYCPLNHNKISLGDIRELNENPAINTLPILRNGTPYHIEYSPVGNYIGDPRVIICGKTPGKNTSDMFFNKYKETGDVNLAAFQSIYSNMKDNLFRYLDKIHLFDYLEQSGIEYWSEKNRMILWNKIFTDYKSAQTCGIQLTQACDCAILCGNSSSEPSGTSFDYIYKNCPECLFNSFIVSHNLKLIIFLDTPSNDGRFHQKNYIDKLGLSCKIISITHPSGQNNDIYHNLDNLTTNTVRTNRAKELLDNAMSVISQLMNS